MYQAPKVGSVEPLAIGQLVIGLRLLDRLQRRLQVGPRGQRDLAEVVERLQARQRNRTGPVTSNCSTGVRSFEQLQQLNLGCAQVDDRRLQLRLRTARAAARCGRDRSAQCRRP